MKNQRSLPQTKRLLPKEREFDYVGLVEADYAYTYRKGLKPNEMTISKPEATTPQTERIVSPYPLVCNINSINVPLIRLSSNCGE